MCDPVLPLLESPELCVLPSSAGLPAQAGKCLWGVKCIGPLDTSSLAPPPYPQVSRAFISSPGEELTCEEAWPPRAQAQNGLPAGLPVTHHR